jgi:meso-butanediol dehydrogenase/(S,S)-butanediol dehydrogenase/diacetyl reductase
MLIFFKALWEGIENMQRFTNKVVLITGGATGIGLSTAKKFNSEGAVVVIAGLSDLAGEEAVQEISQFGGKAYFVKADIAIEDEVKRLINQAIQLAGRIDIVVNNAAMFYTSSFLEETSERWHNIFNIIVDGAYFTSKYAAKHMVDNGIHGSIVNVSSINAHRALDLSSHYNAAKGALDQLTRCIAFELSPFQIRVNGVAPGFIETPMSVVNGVKEHETEEFQNYYVNKRKIPLARHGQPEEVANVILFLASEEASYIQGTIIPVDGGLSNTF